MFMLKFLMRMQMAMLPFHGVMLMVMMPVFMIVPVVMFNCFVNMGMNMPLAHGEVRPRRHYN